MLPQHIALVPTAGGVDPSDLARVGAALQRQVASDLAPLWGVSATVAAFPALEDVPIGYWPILLSGEDEASRQAGRCLDENGQPYAVVPLSPHWSVAASRACLELLVNPSGARTVPCASPRYDQGPVQLLLEICAACADPSHAYAVHDVLVSDFCTPAFFTEGGQDRYSFYGSIGAPFQLLAGGRMIWFEPSAECWWLRMQDEGEAIDIQLGALGAGVASVSELVRHHAPPLRRTWALSGAAYDARAQLFREQANAASRARAAQLRSLLGPSVEARPEPAVPHEEQITLGQAVEARPEPEPAAPHEEHIMLYPQKPTLNGVGPFHSAMPPPLPSAHVQPPTASDPAPSEPPSARAPSAPGAPLVPARPPERRSSSIAPALSLVDDGRSRDGLDWRLLAAGALVCAAVAALVWRGRHPPSMPVAHGPRAASSVPHVVAESAGAGATPAPAPGPRAELQAASQPTATAPARAAPVPPPPPGQAKRRARARARVEASQPDQAPREAAVEDLFDTRR